MAKKKKDDLTPLEKRRLMLSGVCGSIAGLVDQLGERTHNATAAARIDELVRLIGPDLTAEDRAELVNCKLFLERHAKGLSLWSGKLQAMKGRIWAIKP